MNIVAVILVICSISLVGAPLFSDLFFSPEHRSMRCCTMQVPSSCSEGQMHPCTCTGTLPKCCACATFQADNRVQTLFTRIRRYIAGYRRLSEKTLLEHDTRRRLYEVICDLPGIDLKDLVMHTGMNASTIRYHLWQMEHAGKIRVMSDGGCMHYFENHGRYSEQEQQILAVQYSGGGSRTFDCIRNTPGLTRGELAGELRISGPSVTRSVQRLIGKGLVHQEKDGKYTRYYPVES